MLLQTEMGSENELEIGSENCIAADSEIGSKNCIATD
jgi:hypothetical protein